MNVRILSIITSILTVTTHAIANSSPTPQAQGETSPPILERPSGPPASGAGDGPVKPAAGGNQASPVLLDEVFDYADGPLITAPASPWSTHSGTEGQILVASGAISLSSNQNEDVSAALLGAPYATDSGAVLYAALTVSFTALPTSSGSYFAHYNPSGFRARIYAKTANAGPGSYRIGVANNSGTPVEWPADLSLLTPYQIVTRYDAGSGETQLWIDPETEADLAVTATDTPSPSTINTFSLRQQSGIGSARIEDLRVATSFGDAIGEAAVRLVIGSDGQTVRVSWPADPPDYVLQSTPVMVPADWVDVAAEIILTGNRKVVELKEVEGTRFFRLILP